MNDDKSVLQLLQQIGFSEAESVTYWTLLQLDNVSIRKISAKSGINRGTTYDAIKQLVTDGLVHSRKSGQRSYFSAEPPDKIYNIIRDRRKQLLLVQKQADNLIPKLLASKAEAHGKPLVKYYEDDDGIVTILKDVLHTCSQLPDPRYYVYSSRSLRKYLYKKFPDFTKRRIAEGISVQVIAIGEGSDTEGLSQRKWLPVSEDYESSSYTIIYANKVVNISVSDNDTPYGIMVEDAGVASMQRLLFEHLWETV